VLHLAPRLATIPGVVAVSLGGSRACGTERADSDWDFGLHYRGTLDPDDVRALGFGGQVFAPHEWGPVINGGAWLTVDGERVDLIYQDLDQVESWIADAEVGTFEIHRLVGYVAGIPTYNAVGALAVANVLHGELPRPAYPIALRDSAPPIWRNLAAGAIASAEAHADRRDHTACIANLALAALCEAHARCAERGEWVLNEKGLIDRAGLQSVQRCLDGPERLWRRVSLVREQLALEHSWGRQQEPSSHPK
jgi:hypothetical protein